MWIALPGCEINTIAGEALNFGFQLENVGQRQPSLSDYTLL